MNSNFIQSRLIEINPDIAKEIGTFFNFERLETYYQFLKEFNEIGGFFSKSDSENILDRHVIETIIHIYKILTFLPISDKTTLVDIGTGPGLPGYIFYSLINAPQITLVDSQMRRLSFLEKFHKETYTDSKVKFLYSRVEDIKEKFDLVVMRSTIKYPWSSEMVIQLLKQNASFIPFLGKRNYDIDFEAKFLLPLGLKIQKEVDIKELEFLGSRHFKILKKTDETKKGFPRKWEIISKEIKRTSWEK